jgi:hypothetical protein
MVLLNIKYEYILDSGVSGEKRRAEVKKKTEKKSIFTVNYKKKT